MTRNHIPGVSSEYRGEVFKEAYWGLGFGINGTKKEVEICSLRKRILTGVRQVYFFALIVFIARFRFIFL